MDVSYIGASNLIATNGSAPGAITPHANTQTGDLLIAYHYGRATGGNETVTAPAGQGWTQLFQSVTANNGHVAVFWKIRQVGDGTSTFTVANYTSGTTGETILQWIETYRGHNPSVPVVNFTAALSTWPSSTNIGSIAAPSTATVIDGATVVVFGGRFENITAQTTLTGDSLTWAQNVRNDTTQGTDAGAVTQRGENQSGSTQTVTAKTITTTGTTQAGAGRMFIIEPQIDTPVSSGLGELTATGYSPTIAVTNNQLVASATGALTGNGYSPILDTNLAIGVGAITVVGYEPNIVVASSGINTFTGEVTFSGYSSTLDLAVNPDKGDISSTGYSPVLNLALTTDVGQLVVEGHSPTVSTPILVSAGLGTLNVVGYAPILALEVASDTGQGILTGYSPSLDTSVLLDAGIINLVGHEPLVQIAQVVTTDKGLIVVIGYEATIDVTNNIALSTGKGELICLSYAPEVQGTEIIAVVKTKKGGGVNNSTPEEEIQAREDEEILTILNIL